jgi:hypothetical protein
MCSADRSPRFQFVFRQRSNPSGVRGPVLAPHASGTSYIVGLSCSTSLGRDKARQSGSSPRNGEIWMDRRRGCRFEVCKLAAKHRRHVAMSFVDSAKIHSGTPERQVQF